MISATDLYSRGAEFGCWLLEVKSLHREALSRREERELFAEFCEDFNTATLPSDKYYDLEAWSRREREAAAGPASAAASASASGLSDEERLRHVRRLREEEGRRRVEDERLREMKRVLEQAKAAGGGGWQEVQRRHDPAQARPTFESIARQREMDKRAEADKLRRKWK